MTHHTMANKRVVDSEGLELGVITKVEDKYIEVSEGLFDELLLSKEHIGKEEENEVVIGDNIQHLLSGMEVCDSKGDRIGAVRETVSAGDVLDSLIIEKKDKGLVFITLEEIYKIDENIKLDIDAEEVNFRQKTHTLREHIKHYLEKIQSR